MKTILNIEFRMGRHGVWNNQVGRQKWLPKPNTSDQLNSDRPVVEIKSALQVDVPHYLGFIKTTRMFITQYL